MANEAQIRQYDKTYLATDYTCADGVGIEKGAFAELTDPRTVAANNGNGDVIAGIIAREKVASDGRTQVAVWESGIFDCVVASGASITTGELVSTSGANVIKTATEAEIAAGKALGKALEDGSDSERIQVHVGKF